MGEEGDTLNQICTAIYNEMVYPLLNEGKEPVVLWPTLKKEIAKALAKQKVADYEQVQWELTELLIKERETGGHIDLAKYIKRLNKLKATKGSKS